MGNDNKVKNIILAVLVVGLVGMTIAYAALTQTLNISDNEVTVASNWSVKFANGGTATASSVSGNTTASINTQPTLTATTISGLRATFRKPGDKVEYEFDILNEGSIDAKLDSVVYGTPSCTSSDSTVTSETLTALCNKVNYSIVYTDTSTAPAVNDDLLNGTANKRHCKLTVELDSTVTSLPTADVTISGLTATFNYVQK